MLNAKRDCDPSSLDVLLFGQEESDEYRAAASHIETCRSCRAQLANLAADAATWQEARDLLSGYPSTPDAKSDFIVRSETSPPRSDECEPSAADVELLGQPRHPEMLGRLGRYDIVGVIGRGGMGVVFKGFDTELNRPVAIKALAPHLAHSGAARQRFAREARAAAAVVHEHVVAIHNVESEGQAPFLVMQYVRGESLQARVDRDGPLDAKEVLRIGTQAAAGLAAAHEQGVVHRDVKPSNILLEEGVERALLTDFGLARTVDDASLTHTGIVAGTPHYMSPEQANGEETDFRTDLFSLGSVLYFMATGRPPFRADRAMGVLHRICRDRHRPIWRINPDVPDSLVTIIDRLLEKRPSRRPASASEVQQSLAKALARLQEGRRPSTNHVWRFVRQWKLAIAAVAAAGLLAFTVSQFPWASQRTPQSSAADSTATSTGTSVDALQWVYSSEPSLYESAIQQLNQRIDVLGSALRGAVSGSSDTIWNQQVESIHRRLDAVQAGGLMLDSQFDTMEGEIP